MKKYIIEITVFLCGALGMVLELVAARVLSPYVGSSNLIWTIIIGVMLTSMSLGYWVGGKKADKNPNKKTLSEFILIGAFFTSLIPILETTFVKTLTEISDSLVLVALITSAVIFGIPSFVLATVSPFAVKLQEEKDDEHKNIGKVSGKTSSLSTIGSIIGTFVAGFVLIPTFGIRTIIFGITIILIIISIALYGEKTKKYYIFITIIIICLIGLNVLGKVVFDKANPDLLKDVDSEYSRIWIKQVKVEDMSYKTLQVDKGIESYIDEKTGEMGAKYLYYYDLAQYFNKNVNSTLIIGGAAYTYPTYYLQKYPDKTIDVSEIDEKMTRTCSGKF